MWQALIVCLLFAGCASSHENVRPRTGPKPLLVEVGDSLTVVSSWATTPALRVNYRVQVVAKVGDVEKTIVPLVVDAVAAHPAVVIIQAGTDEALTHAFNWRPAFDHIVTAVRNVPCVVFVNVQERVPDYFGWWHAGKKGPMGTISAEWNRALARTARTHPNFRIVDWNAAVVADPKLLSGLFHIHASTAGARWLRDQFRTAIASC